MFDSWDEYYQNDLDNQATNGDEPTDPSELDSWFDDVDAPAKTFEFLTSESFPLSPNSAEGADRPTSVLDVGTGNGSSLLSLRFEGGYRGEMVGIDYSPQSIYLAEKLVHQQLVPYQPRSNWDYLKRKDSEMAIYFALFDIIHDDQYSPENWWPNKKDDFDLVLDKGTFDAISLSSETVLLPGGNEVRVPVAEVYPLKIARLMRLGGFFLITSCNWTQDEVVRWFTTELMKGVLEVYDTITYPTFQFGGHKGQGVASVCFRKIGGVGI